MIVGKLDAAIDFVLDDGVEEPADHHPAIAREATRAYERRRAASRKAKANEAEAVRSGG